MQVPNLTFGYQAGCPRSSRRVKRSSIESTTTPASRALGVLSSTTGRKWSERNAFSRSALVPDVSLSEDDLTGEHVDRFEAASELLDGG